MRGWQQITGRTRAFRGVARGASHRTPLLRRSCPPTVACHDPATGRSLRMDMITASQLRIRTRLGLTLVEVLVTTVVVAILIALVSGAVSRSREQARIVTCQSNLRNLATGILTYRDENGPLQAFGAVTNNLPERNYTLRYRNCDTTERGASVHQLGSPVLCAAPICILLPQ
jgi:prepilin-type N-terminal cleavage/methylation domain-containing protein